MSYSEITFSDRNPVKRWLQRRRLVVALQLAQQAQPPRTIIDIGAGNGELCKMLKREYRDARIICHEPSPLLLAEARENLRHLPGIDFCADIAEIPAQAADLAFCLEVFEHLPPPETAALLDQIERILSPTGRGLIGVPVEVGLPALYKGLFRAYRRPGAYDATLGNILRAACHKPPQNRPMAQIAPGLQFHHEHMGFDFKTLQKQLQTRFRIIARGCAPIAFFGPHVSPEINYLIAPRAAGAIRSRGEAPPLNEACMP